MMKYDLIVTGGGPAGLSAAIEAKRKNINVIVLDKGAIVNSIQNFPPSMIFFSTVELLEIGGVPFIAGAPRPTRAEAVNYYARVAHSSGIEFKGNSRVVSVRRPSDGQSRFTVEVKNEITSLLTFMSADRIVAASGFFDNPNLLGVPGEGLPNVSHTYREPGLHFGQKVVIIGGKNSAVEAALDLYRHGVNVTILYWREWFGKSVKYWILPDIENRVRNGEIIARFNANVLEIKPDRLIADVKGEREEFECDYVYALTGYHPDVNFLRYLGIEIDQETGIPKHNPETFESNVPGIYVAGSIVAGYDCNKIFIENGREHGKQIAENLAKL